jgi:hypothetical protein
MHGARWNSDAPGQQHPCILVLFVTAHGDGVDATVKIGKHSREIGGQSAHVRKTDRQTGRRETDRRVREMNRQDVMYLQSGWGKRMQPHHTAKPVIQTSWHFQY